MNKVEQIFISKAINRHGIILYSSKDAIEFIRQCNNYQIELLGIDGFFLKANTIQPSLENSLVFSNNSTVQNNYDKAIEFINSRKEELYFEVICA